MSDRDREILSWYSPDNPGVLRNLARMMNTGRLAGTREFVILPVDQGCEHGPARSFASNPRSYEPRLLMSTKKRGFLDRPRSADRKLAA